MTKSFNKFVKPCFWPIFGPFPDLAGKKICHAQLYKGF